jgi:hypothetical protein
MWYGEGYWIDKKEYSLCIEICTDGQWGYTVKRIKQAAEEIKELNEQDTVLIVKVPSTLTYV